MNIEKIKEFVEKNPQLVSLRESITHPGLFVVKYKKKVFYDNLWTPELMETRGLVVDKDWKIVAYPFTKIFNRGENGTDIDPEEEVVAVRKINGFLGCITWYKTRQIVSTTGSLDSDFVKMAEQNFKKLNPAIMPNFTYMFEVCDPLDPHIIPEEPGIYLIGVRNLSSHEMLTEEQLDREANLLNNWSQRKFGAGLIKRPSWLKTKFSEVLKMAKLAQHEGYVVYGKNGVLKIKTPYYLVSKFLSRKNMEKLSNMIENPNELKKTIDEEYYPLVDTIVQNKDKFIAMDEQGRLGFIREYFSAE